MAKASVEAVMVRSSLASRYSAMYGADKFIYTTRPYYILTQAKLNLNPVNRLK